MALAGNLSCSLSPSEQTASVRPALAFALPSAAKHRAAYAQAAQHDQATNKKPPRRIRIVTSHQ